MASFRGSGRSPSCAKLDGTAAHTMRMSPIETDRRRMMSSVSPCDKPFKAAELIQVWDYETPPTLSGRPASACPEAVPPSGIQYRPEDVPHVIRPDRTHRGVSAVFVLVTCHCGLIPQHLKARRIRTVSRRVRRPVDRHARAAQGSGKMHRATVDSHHRSRASRCCNQPLHR